MLNQQRPEYVGALVEKTHGKIRQHIAEAVRTAPYNRRQGKDPFIAILVAGLQFCSCHVARLKNDMGGVIAVPIAVQDPLLFFQFPEERGAGIGRENVKGGIGIFNFIRFYAIRSLRFLPKYGLCYLVLTPRAKLPILFPKKLVSTGT